MQFVIAFVNWLEASRLGEFIRESEWAFPAAESVHVIGLALVIGTISIVDLRLLGLASTNRVYSELAEQVLPWTWGAFVLAAISGTLMFISQPWTYLDNAAFRIKFALMFLAAINMLVFQLITIGEISNWDRKPLRRSRERSPPRFRSCSGSRSYSSAGESASRRSRCNSIEWPPMGNETEAHDDRSASHTLATSKGRRDRIGGIHRS